MSFAVTREITVYAKRNLYGEPVTRRVRVEVDVQALAQSLGQKAYGNKSRVAKESGGHVRVYAVDP